MQVLLSDGGCCSQWLHVHCWLEVEVALVIVVAASQRPQAKAGGDILYAWVAGKGWSETPYLTQWPRSFRSPKLGYII